MKKSCKAGFHLKKRGRGKGQKCVRNTRKKKR